MPFRITPSLGPDIEQVGPHYFDADQPGHSYELGSIVHTSDGRHGIFVTAAAGLAAGARVNINRTTWVATANASGTHVAPVAVPSGESFHAVEYFA